MPITTVFHFDERIKRPDMTTTLFRPEALHAAGDADFGAPIALMPWSWWALLSFLMIFAAATITFLATATFPRKEAAIGILRFSHGEIRVTPRRTLRNSHRCSRSRRPNRQTR